MALKDIRPIIDRDNRVALSDFRSVFFMRLPDMFDEPYFIYYASRHIYLMRKLLGLSHEWEYYFNTGKRWESYPDFDHYLIDPATIKEDFTYVDSVVEVGAGCLERSLNNSFPAFNVPYKMRDSVRSYFIEEGYINEKAL